MLILLIDQEYERLVFQIKQIKEEKRGDKMRKLICAAVAAFFALTPVTQAKAGGYGECGVHSAYLAGLGAAYDAPVKQCFVSAPLAKREGESLSLQAFFSHPFEGGWWNNSGSEVDIMLGYEKQLGSVDITLGTGVFITPGSEILFGSMEISKTFTKGERFAIKPTLLLELDSVIGGPSTGVVELGAKMAYTLTDRLKFVTHPELRCETNGACGALLPLGVQYNFDEQTALLAAVEARRNFETGITEEAVRLKIGRRF